MPSLSLIETEAQHLVGRLPETRGSALRRHWWNYVKLIGRNCLVSHPSLL